jgi:Beta/Gamma crystallin
MHMLKTVVMTASLATGLLMIDVAQPILLGGVAQAAPQRKPVFRPARVAPRVVAKPRVHFAQPKSTFAKPETTFRKPATFQKKVVAPQIVPKQPLKANFNPQLKKAVIPNQLQKANPQLVNNLKLGPNFGKQKFVPKPFPVIKIANKPWPIHKGPHKLWWKGGWKVFVPFTAITVAVIGGAYYYPDAYVSVARPYCSGITPDGCRLNWQEVPFDGGGSEWQCVQFCPRPNQPPPARSAALVVAPPSGGRCEVEIFAQPQFAGLSAQSTVDQPQLAEAGWKNEIASIQVKAGTWDFFSEDEFAGENMRLPPGPYPDLGPQWNKRIGSFMCVQGG